jgi:phosphatidylglycerophosphate synthase
MNRISWMAIVSMIFVILALVSVIISNGTDVFQWHLSIIFAACGIVTAILSLRDR